MRVSEYYKLGRAQPSLSFVDVHIDSDVPAFVDPTAIRIQESEWAHICKALLQSFFTEVLEAVASKSRTRAIALMGPLSEPNETHLGWSKGKSRGRGLGPAKALNFLAEVQNSAAAHSGLLADLEDTSLLIDGVGPDIISDITTNVIRGALIGYTQSVCRYHGIDMEAQYSGFIWNPDALEWQEGEELLPRPEGDTLLLVPKSIVRAHLTVDSDKYYNRMLAPRLEALEIDKKSPIVEVLKDGETKVPRKKLRELYPATKLAIVKYTEQFPEALRDYKESLTKSDSPPLSHSELHARTGTPEPNFEKLLAEVLAVPEGSAGATIYHRKCADLLSALFYPYLGNMVLEKEIHEGRKRIDIVFDNLAGNGTFYWLGLNYRAAILPVECKNYTREVENPELDQISGRFSDSRGWFGMIVFRSAKNKDLFLQRCRDTAKDGRGYIIALDDADLRDLVRERLELLERGSKRLGEFNLIRERIDYLIS
ncbi:conserved hypothetical protein [Parafrankia sp. Ea1.12]|uniref:hypothetical protein n=1 Tax=Parafrankia sp. Ea1.12 TaxID=573499 RepID=UPI000DA4330A|nr:hypothetical protein [Parafrankia sp. Ea1.12]SQE00600.1 conserved hypothetical protein [Parafrankia sp. Ea1.12]